MNGRAALFLQAIRGPILLITLGTLFAIHQAGILRFSRTWPLIIIMVGVMKLLERMAMPQAPPGGQYQ
jgi:cell wall-active antibiotic response 4TMS protein YvqF